MPTNTRPRTHKCPGGCGQDVPHHLFACQADWYRLPFEVRKAIQTHYRRDPAAHFAAMSEALEWFAANPLPAQATP